MKKIFSFIFLLFSLFFITDVKAKSLQVIMDNISSSGTPISVPTGSSRAIGLTFGTIPLNSNMVFDIPTAVTMSGNVGRTPNWYAKLELIDNTGYSPAPITCSLSPFYAQSTDTSSNFVLSNIHCEWTQNINYTSAKLHVYNTFSTNPIAYWFIDRFQGEIVDSTGGSGSSIDYTTYFNSIITMLQTMDTNGDNRNAAIISYLQTMDTNGDNRYVNIYAKLNEIKNALSQGVVNAIDNQTQFLQDDDTTGANTGYGSVFNESIADTSGTTALFGVLQNFISNLSTNDTCSSFSIPIPFLNSQNLVLPCMRSVYVQHFGLIYNLVQIILSAIIFYWCVVNVLKLFKETLDPFNYKLEVLDL